ncbi:AAA family ATPase [Streptomyces sp. 8L]|uniref:AAA family ATPase n=1 Tax=Streptomyces sp. 8L TaxID=2877242 RepID=UPI001CD2E9D8|nr:SMC family ATPase [Streptomyces sp. 8L]MCA1216861.1 SMC family ATPase [Streptomyces sp. 8L]
MRLHRMTVTAFGPFAGTQEIDFDALAGAGVFLLRGQTGAGKTSVLDAVCFALYGGVPGARQKPGIVLRSDHAAPGTLTQVTLDLTVAGRRIEVTRSPAQQRPKKGRAGFTTVKAASALREYDAAAGAWRALSRTHQEIGKEVTELLGMSREQFCQVVLLPQGDFAQFLQADAEQRAKLLGRLFDTHRFAAVEDRLAELRRGAETRVRAGDERLYALAQRIAQAAGPGGAPPPPERAPGDPGLAQDILAWAAAARSVAVERCDIAARALAQRGALEAEARAELDAQSELARLQRRFAETRERAESVEESRSSRDEAQARLDADRRAERVQEALTLREAAGRDHTAALAACGAARLPLPADLADAGAEQLTSAERSVREELGALASARAAEARVAEIGRERAELERQLRADDETAREAAAWLAGWDGLRARLREEIEATQQAATRAERFGALLDPALRRLEAARDRDDAERTEREAATRAARAGAAAVAAHETWLDLRERRLDGMAAELAAGLAAGEPCSVCGSTQHPAPARPAAGQVDAAAEDAAQAGHRRAEEARAAADAAHARVREAYAAAHAEAGDAPVSELAEEADRLSREHEAARTVAARAHSAREALAAAEREHRDRQAAQQHAELAVAARTSQREALEGERAALSEELARATGAAAGIAERAAELERRAGLLAAAADAVRAVESTAGQLKDADARLADAAYRAGFDTPEAAGAALLDGAARRELQHRVDAWQREAAIVAERLLEQDASDAGARPHAAPEAARAAHDAAERALREASTALAAAQERRTELGGLSARADTEARALGPLRTAYDRVAGLATLTAGTSADNERRMRLESYVLAARLEQVAQAATVRLQHMSAGRYALVHTDARVGQRRSGLGLHVVDAWTGSARDTATLSGGETFFVSLALALGLADVVSDEAGGVRLDTLFIDEGFGTLDDQTLDEVLDVLDGLRERDRSVGIVSHVADLRRRIPVQLEVMKGRHGSTVRLRTAPLD